MPIGVSLNWKQLSTKILRKPNADGSSYSHDKQPSTKKAIPVVVTDDMEVKLNQMNRCDIMQRDIQIANDVMKDIELKRALPSDSEDDDQLGGTASKPSSKPHKKQRILSTEERERTGKYVAIDCEMVGVGDDGVRSALARVSIVNYNGHVLYDTFVIPQEKVTDYRTKVSGIRPDLISKHGRPFAEVQKAVADIIENRILVGHALKNDLDALFLTHPQWLVRDTSRYGPLKNAKTGRPNALRNLAREHAGMQIQSGEHSSVEDARATMLVYRKFKSSWESEVKCREMKRKRSHK